ncbi:MAG TPA: thioredoxin domain-containing protein [Polyangiales bacterium]|nr:thioredoxin domain-containing protein [Polyangiales bacterium]
MKAHSIISTLVAVAALVGCNQASRGKDKTKATSATACADYSARVCKEAGEQSTTCTTIKSASELLAPEACATALTKVDFTLKKLGEQGKKCDELIAKLCTDIGDSTQTCEMVKSQAKTFAPDRCALMIEHYDEVLADLKKQEEKNKPLSAEKATALAQGAVPAFGPADAKVTIVEFSDFQCPYCSRAAEATHKVKEKYGDKVRFVFRQFPLSFHKDAHTAAEASLAANAQGKFWEFHDKLFANQQKLDRASLEGYAKELGLNVDKFKKSLDSKEYVAAVDGELKMGEDVAVQGTPTMFLNGARIADPTNFEAISSQIDEALKKGG